MKTLGYYNGTIGEIDQMMVPMNDRACVFGDGVYDATLAANHKIYGMDEHVDRFFNSAALLEIPMPCTKPELKQLLRDLVKKVDSPDQFVYFQVTRGTAMRNHSFPEGKANLWVMLTPRKLTPIDKQVKLITVEDNRFYLCNIKTLNLIPSVLASQKATLAGCDEAVFHRGDRVTECAHSNISILKDGVFRTAPLDRLILPGTARKRLLEACAQLGIPAVEEAFTLSELFDADEVIVSSSGSLCQQAVEIDGKPVGGRDGDRLRALQKVVLGRFEAETCPDA